VLRAPLPAPLAAALPFFARGVDAGGRRGEGEAAVFRFDAVAVGAAGAAAGAALPAALGAGGCVGAVFAGVGGAGAGGAPLAAALAALAPLLRLRGGGEGRASATVSVVTARGGGGGELTLADALLPFEKRPLARAPAVVSLAGNFSTAPAGVAGALGVRLAGGGEVARFLGLVGGLAGAEAAAGAFVFCVDFAAGGRLVAVAAGAEGLAPAPAGAGVLRPRVLQQAAATGAPPEGPLLPLERLLLLNPTGSGLVAALAVTAVL
jgi:hypothetical protein